MPIYFSVAGGFANLVRSVTISDGGAATVEVSGRTSEGEIGEATLRQIAGELDRSGLFDRDRHYAAAGADLQRYEIRYAGSTVVAFDTSLPGELTEVVRMLEEVIRGVPTS